MSDNTRIEKCGSIWQLQMLGVIVLSLLVEGAIYAADGEAVRSTLLSEMDLRNIDSYLERQLTEANIPGAALVIVEGDRVTHVRGFGIAGPDSRPVTGETPFYLGSVTKSFTALAVMQLVETGQIELEAPIQNYLPWFRVAHADASSEMKVKHLLNHTSGFSTYAGRTHCTASDMSAEAIERRVRALQTAKLISPVGEGINTATPTTAFWELLSSPCLGKVTRTTLRSASTNRSIWQTVTRPRPRPNKTTLQQDTATGLDDLFPQLMFLVHEVTFPRCF